MPSKNILNALIQQQEISRTLMRSEIQELRARLYAAHRKLYLRRWPWYRRWAFTIRHPLRRIP